MVKYLNKNHSLKINLFYFSPGQYSKYFAIDANGLVTIQDGTFLDRENIDSLTLRVIATDSAPFQQSRQSSVPLHITVLDINDHGPDFSQKIYSVSVVENIPLNPPAPIVQVMAHDDDAGVNALVQYTILDGNERGI